MLDVCLHVQVGCYFAGSAELAISVASLLPNICLRLVIVFLLFFFINSCFGVSSLEFPFKF